MKPRGDHEQMYELRLRGMSYGEIARAVNASKETVYRNVKRVASERQRSRSLVSMPW